MKTNAVRALDSLGIPYELKTYEVDESDLSAPTVAAKVELPVEQVFKTLLVRGPKRGEAFAVIPGNTSLDLKALARLARERRMTMVPLKDVQRLTGYIRGGVTALAAKKPLPVYVDETVELFDRIAVSAGVRGCQMLLSPADYLAATEGVIGELGRDD